MFPYTKCTIFQRILPVCSAEKVSVENKASTPSHNSVGTQYRKTRQGEFGAGVSITDDDNACTYSTL